jgi:hypothetical protein
MKRYLFLLIILNSFICFSQDTSSVKKENVYGGDIYFTLAPRLGFGIHHNPYYELGFSGILVNTTHLGFGATSFYSTMIFHQTSMNSSFDTYGAKLGVQASFVIFMWGLEGKVLFFEDENNFYISPKFGFSLIDAINIEYAINIGKVSNDMIVKTRHQVSLNISLNRRIYKEIKLLTDF